MSKLTSIGHTIVNTFHNLITEQPLFPTSSAETTTERGGTTTHGQTRSQGTRGTTPRNAFDTSKVYKLLHEAVKNDTMMPVTVEGETKIVNRLYTASIKEGEIKIEYTPEGLRKISAYTDSRSRPNGHSQRSYSRHR